MALPRGLISTSTGDSLTINVSDGFLALTDAANLSSLVTNLSDESDFDMPANGRLRYTGTLSKVFTVTGSVSARSGSLSIADFEFRIAKNGTGIDSSVVKASFSASIDYQPATFTIPVLLAQNDTLDLEANLVASVVDPHSLSIEELSIFAFAIEAAESVSAPASGTGLANVGPALLDAYGEAATFRKTSAGTYDPTTRSYTGESVTTATTKVYVEPFTLSEVDGSAIVSGDQKIWASPDPLEAVSYTPEVGDFVQKGSKYRVLSIEAYRVGDEVAVYFAHARGVE